jgi:hypothetical protein
MAKRKKYKRKKQRSTKHTHKTKDRVTRSPLKTGGELRCSGRMSGSSSTDIRLWKYTKVIGKIVMGFILENWKTFDIRR